VLVVIKFKNDFSCKIGVAKRDFNITIFDIMVCIYLGEASVSKFGTVI
jgi:hypothetical protein